MHHCLSTSHSLGKPVCDAQAEYASEQVFGGFCDQPGLVTEATSAIPAMQAPITKSLRILKILCRVLR